MTEEKYNTKDIRHINKKNQEYIAENNRMTEKIELTTEVLNCDYFNRNRGFNCYKGKNCTEAPDCYYRQLKRLEQENKDFEILAKSLYKRIEELEKENEDLAFREILYKADYKASEQENKELKEKIKDKSLQCIFYNDKQNKCVIFTKTVAYNRALREIREKIESLNKDICNNCGWYNTDNCQPNGYVCHDLIEIKNKINEVLEIGKEIYVLQEIENNVESK